jgi:hypothetical protein
MVAEPRLDMLRELQLIEEIEIGGLGWFILEY